MIMSRPIPDAVLPLARREFHDITMARFGSLIVMARVTDGTSELVGIAVYHQHGAGQPSGDFLVSMVGQ